MTDRPLVYIAGPMTGDPYGCVRQAIEAFDRLRPLGCTPFLPQLSVLHEIVSHRSHASWIDYDLDVINHCKALVRLPGESVGADKEVAHAEWLGLPVFDYGNPAEFDQFTSWLASR